MATTQWCYALGLMSGAPDITCWWPSDWLFNSQACWWHYINRDVAGPERIF